MSAGCANSRERGHYTNKVDMSWYGSNSRDWPYRNDSDSYRNHRYDNDRYYRDKHDKDRRDYYRKKHDRWREKQHNRDRWKEKKQREHRQHKEFPSQDQRRHREGRPHGIPSGFRHSNFRSSLIFVIHEG